MTLDPGRARDPGLFGPGSVVWRVARERILLAGGPAALLLQLAHPLIAEAVAAHSGFRREPLQRLLATLDATLTITFGDHSQAEAAAARVTAVHRRVRGALSEETGSFPRGTPYQASDPELAMWVYATLVSTALDVYGWAVAPLSSSELERYYQEGKRFAFLFGVTQAVMPPSYSDFTRYVGDICENSTLAVGSAAARLGRGVLDPPLVPLLRGARMPTRLVTAWLLPEPLRGAFGLRWGSGRRTAVAALGSSIRTALPAVPASVRFWPHYRAARARSAE